MFILDTNVVSELRKLESGRAEARVVAWFAAVAPETLYLSAMTILELEAGALRVEWRGDHPQARRLRGWLEHQLMPSFAERILPIDTTIARRCAALHVPDRRPDRDAFIAATALVHSMTVVTRNTADFRGTGAKLLDPWRA